MTHFRLPAIVALLSLLALAPLAAEEFLSANDLAPATLTAPLASEGFAILASTEKSVVIEALGVEKKADDGEVFNARIKLGGAGSADFRSVRFATSAAATLVVYLNSSSKTDPRILKVMGSDGAVVTELKAPADADGFAGMASVSLPGPGTWTLSSAASGINLYQIVVK